MVSQRAPETRAERQARTRSELLAEALALFCERGFHATSLDLVASTAGYTKGAIYSNFASKEDLFFALYERRVKESNARWSSALAEGATPVDVARSVIGQRRDAADDGWLAVFFEFWAHVLRRPDLRERFERLHREGRAPLVAAIEDGYGGDIPVDAEAWTLAITAMVTGLSLEQLTHPDLDAATLAVTMIDTLTRGANA